MSDAVVLISGGASGLGLAIARRAVAAGARALLWDIDGQALAEAQAELGAEGALVDVADPAAVARAEAALPRPPTHLVNNAGLLGRPMPLDAPDPAEIDRILGVNLRGTLCVTAAFLRRRAAHPRASIVNLSSIAGRNGGAPGHAVYGATKGAMDALTRAMARDLAPAIRVNALAPGIIDTAMQQGIYRGAEALAAAGASVPLGRVGQSEDVAEAAEWLLFGAAYVTGEVIRVAGGRR